MDLFLQAGDDNIWLCGGELEVATTLLEDKKEVENTADGFDALLSIFDGVVGRVPKKERILAFFMKHPDEKFEIVAVR